MASVGDAQLHMQTQRGAGMQQQGTPPDQIGATLYSKGCVNLDVFGRKLHLAAHNMYRRYCHSCCTDRSPTFVSQLFRKLLCGLGGFVTTSLWPRV